MPVSNYPMQTRLGIAGAILEFSSLAVWILCEQYVHRGALEWGVREHKLVTGILVSMMVIAVVVTPIWLVWGLFKMPANAKFGIAARPFFWHLGLAVAGLSLPWLFAGTFKAGGFWTVYACLPIYALAPWIRRSVSKTLIRRQREIPSQ